jgi:hypothetical protein
MKFSIHIILIVTLISGCQTYPKRVPDIQYGMMLGEVDDAIWGDDQHQFSALMGDDSFRCYRVEFGQRYLAPYYFTFKNDRLISIAESRPFFRMQSKKTNGTKSARQAPWEPEKRMREIIGAEQFNIERLKVDVATKLDEASKSKNYDMNILPLFIVLSPLLIPYGISEHRKMGKWMEHYDSDRIQLGMTRAEVDDVYGVPIFVVPSASGHTRAYGPSQSLLRKNGHVSLGPSDGRYWVAVVFEPGRATRIFSNDLFDERDIAQVRYLVED